MGGEGNIPTTVDKLKRERARVPVAVGKPTAVAYVGI
jgi:hypothetical protein